jgi:hypothetical protein
MERLFAMLQAEKETGEEHAEIASGEDSDLEDTPEDNSEARTDE